MRDIKAYRKVIGYFGNLESKFDWDLVEKAASEFPDCIFLLAGSTHVASQGSRRANIKLVGAYKYDDLASVASHFDLAIVPHKANKFEPMNPLKLYVYASLGIPVISTKIDNLQIVMNTNLYSWQTMTKSSCSEYDQLLRLEHQTVFAKMKDF